MNIKNISKEKLLAELQEIQHQYDSLKTKYQLEITRQKQIENELLSSTSFLDNIIEQSPYAIWISDNKGTLMRLNQACRDLLNIKNEEVVGKYNVLQDNIVEEQGFLPLVKSVFEEGKAQKFILTYDSAQLKRLHLEKTASVVLEVSIFPIKDVNGKVTNAVIQHKDITEQKQSEDALQKSEQRHRDIFMYAPVGIYLSTIDGKFTVANKRLAEMLGYDSIEELKQKDMASDIYWNKEEREAFILKYAPIESVHNLEVRWKKKDGTPVWISLSSHVVKDEYNNFLYFEGFVQDISEYKRVEAELRESELRFRSLYENSTIGLYRTTPDGQILLANPTLVKMLGYSSFEELSERDLMKEGFDHSSERRMFLEIIEKYGDINGFEVVWKRKDGAVIHIRESARAIRDSKGKSLYYDGIVEDITERKLTEKEIQKSRQELLEFFEDDVTANFISTPDGKLLQCNKTFIKLFGFHSKEESFDYPIEKLYCDSNARKIFIDLIRKNKKIEYLESEFRSLDGRIIITLVNARGEFDETGELVQLRGYILDITERKKAEEGLRKLSRVVEQAPATVVITSPQGVIEYVNEKFCRLTGYTREEAIGKNPRVLNSGYHQVTFYKDLWDTILSGTDWKGDILNRKKNGDLYWESALISPLVNNEGEITHFVGIKEDITDKKKLIDELIKAKEKAEESDRLKSAFLANMSHEIRTPMNGILGFASLLKTPRLSGEVMNEYISIMEKSGARMLNIINDLIDISKIESGQMNVLISECNINEQAEYIYSFFKPEVDRKGITLLLNTGLPEKEAIINSDREKINAILVNLVKNAIKFTDEGTIAFGYTKRRNYLEFFVKDTGIGIEKDKREAIFERFIQADLGMTKAYDGAGLGLSITKAYVEMLGGEIWVESELGKGSQFYFTIPLQLSPDGKETLKETTYHADKETKIKNIKVLIAEDEESAAKYLTIIFQDFCKEILRAKTGHDAIEACRKNPDLDLVLMDIKMPGNTDGHEATRQIREFNKEVVIIAQTAYAHASDREQALKAGCNDYISKPFSQKDIIQMLSKYLMKN